MDTSGTKCIYIMKGKIQYGVIKKLLTSKYKEFDDTVLVESRFKETTRDGKYIRFLQLGLTTKHFVIASEQCICDFSTSNEVNHDYDILEIVSLYPWRSQKLTIFKRTKRKSLKALFVDNSTRYFELADMPKRKIFWNLWYILIMELNSSQKMWPFPHEPSAAENQNNKANCLQLRFIKRSSKEKHWQRWTDKCLYLGLKREFEDKVRPVPVPGLGPPEELKLHYLKPRYFGCWEQSEHWVQCDKRSSESV